VIKIFVPLLRHGTKCGDVNYNYSFLQPFLISLQSLLKEVPTQMKAGESSNNIYKEINLGFEKFIFRINIVPDYNRFKVG